MVTVLQVSVKSIWTTSVTEGKVNANDNAGNKPEYRKTEEGVPVTSHFLLQSVVKPNYKTGKSKEDDCSLLVGVSNFRNLALIQ